MMRVVGTQNVVKNVAVREMQFRNQGQEYIDKATRILHNRVRKNISLIWENVEAQKSHPYSIALGELLGGPWYLVHTETGKMRYLLSKEVVSSWDQIRGGVGYTDKDAEILKAKKSTHSYLRCVIYGTRKMISRDFLGMSLIEMKEEISGLASKFFQRALK